MCGIVGFIDREGLLSHEEGSALLDRMCRVITHRGPDDQGTMLTSDGVALGMRRLSIIDLAGGHQPISNEDGTVSIVFNGEIYNYRELQPELEARGHRFRTNSDTEAIVHAYEEFGADCVAQRVEALRDKESFATEVTNRKVVEHLIAEHNAGTANHADILWTLIALNVWATAFLGTRVRSERLPGAATGRDLTTMVGLSV